MTRIVAGAAGGRRLATPAGGGTRPTSERVREALFSRLDHLGVVAGARVLDLYAGSGALGLEAASRGASVVLLVEQSRSVAAVARRNAAEVAAAVEAAGGAVTVSVRAEPVARVLAGSPSGSSAGSPGSPGRLGPAPATTYDLVLLDPPYDLSEAALATDLERLVTSGWLAAEAIVVVERSVRSPEPSWPPGWVRFAERRYGETRLWYAEGASLPPVAG